MGDTADEGGSYAEALLMRRRLLARDSETESASDVSPEEANGSASFGMVYNCEMTSGWYGPGK